QLAGSLCAIPLWQAMQVFPPAFAAAWTCAAASDCFFGFMPSKLWQLRHSRESVASMVFHTLAASSARCFSNFSGVEMTPVILPQISALAATLRATLWIQSFGTWQSGQPARTPVRFE